MNAQATAVQATLRSLREKAVLVKVSNSCWTARKVDRPLSKKLNVDLKVKEDRQGYYKKWLIPQSALAARHAITNEATKYHKSVTLPWLDDGVRMVPSGMIAEYMAAMRGFAARVEAEDQKFYASYHQHAAEGQRLLGKAANPEDYPSLVQLKRKFGFDIKLLPIPDIEDWRMDVSKKEMDELLVQAKATMDGVQKAAIMELWQRLFDEVEHMAERLKKSDNVFRNTLISNVKDQCKLLAKLNISGDVQLEAMRKEVDAELTKHTADELRDDDALRQKVATSAAAIMKKMAGYMGDSRVQA